MSEPVVERPSSMADYGVPEDADGLLPWSWAREKLVRSRNYWVVTVGPTGAPHAMPVWGVWDAEDNRFWFSGSPNSRKMRDLADNPNVTVMVDDTVEAVSIQGQRLDSTEPGMNETEIDRAVRLYAAKYTETPEAAHEMIGFVRSHAVVCIQPRRGYAVIEREADFARCATRWRW
jgi:nitroimidazol reductase NimA-like FMN-containing flavoprotein (pyridoxamine 5'-phosphate oxidase superfamily)